MKKIGAVFFIALFLCFLNSCKSDDDDISESDRVKALLGQWEYEAIMTDRAVDLNGDNTFKY